MSLVMILSAAPVFSVFAYEYQAQKAKLVFTESGITEASAGSGYAVDGTALTITAAGTYRISGSCGEGSIIVNKGLRDVTLILDDLTLASSSTAPIVVKKSSSVLIVLQGSSTLTDNEDASVEDTDPDFEGACIKVKSGSSLTFCGSGKLIAQGNAKNGIKGGAESSLLVDGGSFEITAASNGIGFDGSIVINAGTFKVTCGNDGIKAAPDEGDTASLGTIEINGGTFAINAQGDGIHAGTDLTITDGTFTIKTENGHGSTTFNSDTMSCKGLKASGSETDTENASNKLTVTGGTFELDTADDAVHSDAYVVITGGTFSIYTGDDGVHADTELTLGTENGFERDPEISIYASYEGLESGVVKAYSGKYWVKASDDGINAAGGSSNGSDPRPGGGGHFNPGGDSRYSLNFYGGDFYVDCTGDGLDSNGALNLYGGTFTVMSQATGGDNSPLDSDGDLLISGATVFAAGTNPMNERPSSSSQKYYTSTARYTAGTILDVSYEGEIVYSGKLARNINYLLYSSPSMTSANCSLSSVSSVNACKSHAWAHNWDAGVIETAATTESSGVMLFTCKDCGDTERKTIPQLLKLTEYTEAEGEEEEDKGFAVSFVLDAHASINVYYTQDYTTPDEIGVTSTVSRNSDSGDPDSTGNGQVNFTVVPEEGYEIADISVSGSYKNLKGPDDTGLDNTYRITKVASNLTVTVTTAETEPEQTYAQLDGVSLDLSDAISIRFKLHASDEAVSAKLFFEGYKDGEGNGYVEAAYTFDLDKASSDAFDADLDQFILAYPDITSREMMDHVRLVVYDKAGSPMDIYRTSNETLYSGHFDFSAADWCNAVIEKYGENKSNTSSYLAMAVLNFGAEAQKYFDDYNSDKPANPNGYLGDEMAAFEADPANDRIMSDGIENSGFSGMTLDLAERTTIKIKFTAKVSGLLLDGKAAEPVQDGARWLLDIPKLTSVDLKTRYRVSFTGTDGTDHYVDACALSWANAVIEKYKDGSNQTVRLAKAVCLYSQAAENYFMK